jgi:hypothetical protein
MILKSKVVFSQLFASSGGKRFSGKILKFEDKGHKFEVKLLKFDVALGPLLTQRKPAPLSHIHRYTHPSQRPPRL